uniref:Secreted protein n=1 Tax=Candidozyma auris TaxID=498019 RepID=A0A0L0NR64_CANAR
MLTVSVVGFVPLLFFCLFAAANMRLDSEVEREKLAQRNNGPRRQGQATKKRSAQPTKLTKLPKPTELTKPTKPTNFTKSTKHTKTQ